MQRRPTREVMVGDLGIGGDNPISVQSMITEKTSSVLTASEQAIELHRNGAEIVRITAPSLKDAHYLGEIRDQISATYDAHVPLVADVHHKGSAIAVEASKYVDKVRINPGLFVNKPITGKKEDYTQNEIDEELYEIDTSLAPLLASCEEKGIALRIGVNHGSLAERLTVMYGDTPLGMVESALEYLKLCEARDFKDLVVSLKASDPDFMIEANRLMAKRMAELGMDYPLHLGVTEAGLGTSAIVKSTLGIGTLLKEGIGDTIRVSLTADPLEELPVAYDILQATKRRITKTEEIACPGCGRTNFDLTQVAADVFAATSHLKTSIAVMGCVVNGLGEARDAKYAFVGMGPGRVGIFRGKEQVGGTYAQEDAKEVLIDIIKADDIWFDPPRGIMPGTDKELKPRISFIPLKPV